MSEISKEEARLAALIKEHNKEFQDVKNNITAYLVHEGYTGDKTFEVTKAVYEDLDSKDEIHFIGIDITFYNKDLVSDEEKEKLKNHLDENIAKKILPFNVYMGGLVTIFID